MINLFVHLLIFFFFNVDIYRMECRVRDGGRDNYWGSMRWRGSRWGEEFLLGVIKTGVSVSVRLAVPTWIEIVYCYELFYKFVRKGQWRRSMAVQCVLFPNLNFSLFLNVKCDYFYANSCFAFFFFLKKLNLFFFFQHYLS